MNREKNQLKIVIGCIVTATFFWLMNAFSKDNYTQRFNYPISFIYDDSLFIPVQPLPATVSVNVSGDGWSLLRKSLQAFNQEPVTYMVGNPLRAKMMSAVSLKDEIAERFPGLRVNYVVSDTVELEFERKESKVIQLYVDSAAIDLGPGYVMSSYINMSPSLLSVEGPASLVQRYPDSLRIRISRRRIQGNYESTLPIPLRPQPLVKLSHDEVYVSFEVSQL